MDLIIFFENLKSERRATSLYEYERELPSEHLRGVKQL